MGPDMGKGRQGGPFTYQSKGPFMDYLLFPYAIVTQDLERLRHVCAT